MSNLSKQAGFSRLASLTIAMVVAGAGLFLGFRAGQYFYNRSGPAPAVAVAGQQGGQAPVSAEAPASSEASSKVGSEAGGDAPAAEPASAAPEPAVESKAYELPPEPDSKTPQAISAPEVGEKEKHRAAQKRQVEQAAVENSSPVKRPQMTPPAIAGAGRSVMTNNGSLGRLQEHTPSDAQAERAVPVPQQPVRYESRAPSIIRKSGDVLQNSAAFRPQPAYPRAARAAGIEGNVTVEVTINEEGNVISARVINGPWELREAAIAAALRWKWIPARIDRDRARVVGTITFRFKD